MFTRKKYLFPFQKKSRPSRWRKVALFSLLSYLSLVFVSYKMIQSGLESTQRTSDYFYKQSPDLIVVPTGDNGRIQTALELAEKYNLPHIFITGVHEKNSVENITPTDSNVNLNFLEIDYSARNTFENVTSTLSYLRQHPTIKKVLIVSSDYHISRIRMIFNKLKRPNEPFNEYYFSVKHNYKSIAMIKKAHKEVIKYIRNYLMLSLWSPEE